MLAQIFNRFALNVCPHLNHWTFNNVHIFSYSCAVSWKKKIRFAYRENGQRMTTNKTMENRMKVFQHLWLCNEDDHETNLGPSTHPAAAWDNGTCKMIVLLFHVYSGLIIMITIKKKSKTVIVMQTLTSSFSNCRDIMAWDF